MIWDPESEWPQTPSRVFVVRVSDGAEVEVPANHQPTPAAFWLWPEDSYLWEEGNYACDCNRGLFFDRGADADPQAEDVEDHQCSDGLFTIRVEDLYP